jgi:hypothetical protein
MREASAAGTGTNPSGLPLAYTSGDMDGCIVAAREDDFQIICTVDKDGDGCFLNVHATKEMPAYVVGTADCI